jgi:type IV pilus assembly protein PilN
VVLVCLGAIIAFHEVISIKIHHQMMKNQEIEKAIALLDEKNREVHSLQKKRENLLVQMQAIVGLQNLRYQTVKIFNELNRILPKGVVLTQISRKKERITLMGYSHANANISELMKNLEKSYLFENSRLKELKTSVGGGGNKVLFQIAMTQKTFT